ncbi:hypothetical protein CTAYLR_003313 [Chrysophaeum taylorii]|uniref:J domain-containing protein n=1 Tax=Chrysophaeum taylorii TaxID=2483200 RepID=A0AAD7UGE6_9STRA|nr:hypothetical protein CTAYLR_003313 [Chrysophaeum taylorii]
MLEYDDSAFYYFCLTMLGFYVVPGTWWVGRSVVRALRRVDEEARTSLEKKRIEALKEERKPSKVLCSSTFLGNLSLVSAAWACFSYLTYLVAFDGEIARFDPFAILGVDTAADANAIRKAWRQKSLIYHPDKNPNNQTAEEMFLKVTDAYKALTDPVAIENLQKYGNINGHQALKVSFGLPTFLLDQKNHYAILVIYLFLLVVVIPGVVAAWVMRSQKYGENNIMYDTYRFFLHALSEHSSVKMLPEVLAGAAENRSEKAIAPPSSRLRSATHKPRFDHPSIVPINCLIHSHLLRHSQPDLYQPSKTLDRILKNAPKLCDAMLQIAQSQRWLQTSLNIIDFQQYLTQGMWIKDNPLAQLPHLDITHAMRGKGAKTLKEYIRQPNDQKKGIASLSDRDVRDVLRVCDLIPQLSNIECEFYVEDEAEIAEHDLVTLKVSFERRSIGPVHAPKFPLLKQESWWVVVSSNNNLVLAEKIADQSLKVDFKVKLLAPPAAGAYSFNVDLKSSDYVGLDVRKTVPMKVVPASTLPEYKPHQDDLDLDDEPTLFEQVMSTAMDDSSDDEDEDAAGDQQKLDEEDDDDDAAPLTAAERRRRQARIKRKRAKAAAAASPKEVRENDDDDDDDDDD